LVARGLLVAARPLDGVARQRHLSLWNRLRAENADLRVFGDGGLQSAEITAFDSALLDEIAADWLKVARVVGSVLLAREEHEDVGPFFLSARLREMVKAGRIESQGDIFRIRYSEVRLPARQESAALRP